MRTSERSRPSRRAEPRCTTHTAARCSVHSTASEPYLYSTDDRSDAALVGPRPFEPSDLEDDCVITQQLGFSRRRPASDRRDPSQGLTRRRRACRRTERGGRPRAGLGNGRGAVSADAPTGRDARRCTRRAPRTSMLPNERQLSGLLVTASRRRCRFSCSRASAARPRRRIFSLLRTHVLCTWSRLAPCVAKVNPTVRSMLKVPIHPFVLLPRASGLPRYCWVAVQLLRPQSRARLRVLGCLYTCRAPNRLLRSLSPSPRASTCAVSQKAGPEKADAEAALPSPGSSANTVTRTF